MSPCVISNRATSPYLSIRRGRTRREMLFVVKLYRRSVTIVVMVPIAIASGGGDYDPGRLIENQLARAFVIPIVEVEHVVERAGDGIERAAGLNALTRQPVVFDEPEYRRLIGQGMIDVVRFCERRNHQQRHAGSITATSPCRLAKVAVQRRGRNGLSLLEAIARLADSGSIERVHRRIE